MPKTKKQITLKSFEDHASLPASDQEALKYSGIPGDEYTDVGYQIARDLQQRGVELRTEGYSAARLPQNG